MIVNTEAVTVLLLLAMVREAGEAAVVEGMVVGPVVAVDKLDVMFVQLAMMSVVLSEALQ